MNDKTYNGEMDKFIEKMKNLHPGDSHFDEFIEALLIKCNKVDVMEGWTDVSESDKDKLIKALEADEDFAEILHVNAPIS